MSFTQNVIRRVLPNGLTLLVERVNSAPVVAVVTHVRAGYFDEPDEWVGISHVLEHMYFKGTARRGPGEIARETQRAGGYINAGTIYDKTVYYTVLPSAGNGLAQALDMQADALSNAALDKEELGRELEVIVQEAKRKLDSPWAVASERLYELLFRVHRMRRWRIGTEEGLRRLTRDDLWRYCTTRYTPGRVVVGIVGDLDPDTALARAELAFGSWDRPDADVPGSPAEPAGSTARFRLLHGDVERPLGRLGWRTVGMLHPDAAALDAAAGSLGAGRGSSLYRAVRLPGLAHAAAASHYSPADVGVFEIGIEGEGERIDAAMERCLATVAALADAGPSPDELARVRALTETHWARRLEGMDGRASLFCEAQSLGDVHLADELYRRALAVEPADVQRVAGAYLRMADVSGVLYLSTGGQTRFTEHWPPTVAPRAMSPLGTPTLDGAPQRVASGTLSRHAGEIVRWSGAGADVLFRSKRGSGIVTVGLHFAGVPSRETPGSAGISWLATRAALRGAGALGAEALGMAAELMGGGLSASTSAETTGWWMTVAVGRLRDAVRLMRLVALDPTFEPAALEIEREQQAGDARSQRDDMFRYPIQQALHQAFGDDAYGLPTLGTPESVMALTDDAVRQWSAAAGSRRAAVVVVGDLRWNDALAAVAPLADWQVEDGLRDAPGPPRWSAGRGQERRAKTQSALAMAFPARPFASLDRYPLTVLSAVLSGMAGRLFDELRERRSLAYAVAVLPWLARRSGSLITYIAMSPAREAEARDAMLEELGRVHREPPDAAELERARNYAAGLVDVRRQHGAALAGELLDAWVQGALDAVPVAAERLRAVSVDDVVRVAEEVLDPDRRAEYVVRGRA